MFRAQWRKSGLGDEIKEAAIGQSHRTLRATPRTLFFTLKLETRGFWGEEHMFFGTPVCWVGEDWAGRSRSRKSSKSLLRVSMWLYGVGDNGQFWVIYRKHSWEDLPIGKNVKTTKTSKDQIHIEQSIKELKRASL